jgi:hypothetical protein
MHFDQLCTHERCNGYWAIRIDEGHFGGIPLSGVKAIIAYDSPQHMISGGWTEVLIIDSSATADQRRAVEDILTGRAGGPWAVLARFVARWLETRYMAITLSEEGPTKRAAIPGLLDGSITEIRGRDRSQPVRFENIFNQIHSSTQVLARGSTRYDDGEIVVSNEGTHGLYSRFEWIVGAA